MERLPEQNESNDRVLLEKINTELDRLGVQRHIQEIPEISPEWKEVLKHEKIVIVDDDYFIFTRYIPLLMTATEGNASGVSTISKDMFTITSEIEELKPTIVLMDYNMSHDYDGTDITARLGRKFPGKIIGFSTDISPQTVEKFERLGASFIKKSDDPEYSLEALVDFIKNKTE